MRESTNWRLLATLITEEWRLQTQLFGGKRFLLFPVVVGVLTATGAWALTATGTASEDVVTGVHVFALGFGLYTGTAAFVGTDMIENVFGDVTSVLSTVATLPLSRRRLLGAFLLTDALYYAAYVVAPLAIGVGLFVEPIASAPAVIAALWLSLCLVFATGVTITVGLIATQTRGVPGWAILAGVVGSVAALARVVGIVTAFETLVTYGGSPVDGLALLGSVLVGAAVALRWYDTTYSPGSRSATARFDALADRLAGTDGALVTKSLLDLARSSGGIWKPFVSAGILFALVAGLVEVVGSITGIAPAPGLFFGSVLALSAFTTYNWLTQFDSLEDYLAYPISIADVFRAKRSAFLVVGAPTVAVPYLLALALYETTTVDAVVGAVVLAGYSLYLYGLTVVVAGFEPNEFLFDGVRFAAFTVGVAVALVPTLVAGFVVVPPTLRLGGALAAAGLAFGIVGLVLAARAGPRWERRYRREGF